MAKNTFIFKVERPQVAFEAELSNGQKVSLAYLAPNARQLKALQEGGDSLESIERQLREAIVGDEKNAFVDDLLENGSVPDFFNAVTAQIEAQRKAKTKN